MLAAILTLVACRHTDDATASSAPVADELFQLADSATRDTALVSDTIRIQYARGLRVDYRPDGVHVTISNPDPNARHDKPQEFVITRPSRRFICTTALQLGNFEVLGLEDHIVAINSLRNLFSPRIKEQLADGRTARIGKEGNFDLEAVLASRPDYIFVSLSKHGGFEGLKDCGVPLIPHHGYKEPTPLGQAEWIKLVGLLTGQTRRANAAFADIERRYLTLRDEVRSAIASDASASSTTAHASASSTTVHGQASATDSTALPTIISGRQIRDGWYIVGGRSYMAQLFADAGVRYVMADNEDSGGTTLDFEAVYARGADADFWQTDGTYDGDFTLSALAAEDERYATMRAFREGHVLFCNLSRTPYRELASVQPHLLLADFVKAFHPGVLPHYEPHYYRLLQP